MGPNQEAPARGPTKGPLPGAPTLAQLCQEVGLPSWWGPVSAGGAGMKPLGDLGSALWDGSPSGFSIPLLTSHPL